MSIPSSAVPEVEEGLICKYLPDLLDFVCNWTADGKAAFPICETLGFAISATGIGVEIGVPIMLACPEISEAIILTCETIGASPSPGADNAAQGICDAVQEYRQLSNKIIFIAQASDYPKDKYAPSVQADAKGPYPTINFDLGGEPKIKSFTLNPPSPAEYQSYKGSAEVGCIPYGATVSLSIVGTDGYKDSVTYDVTTTQSQGHYDLYVPGSYSGVQDVVTLKIILPNGKQIVRTASLVFQ